MSIFRANNLKDLQGFAKRSDQLAILERDVPENTAAFFQKIMPTSFRISGNVYRESALKDINDILEGEIFKEVRKDPFYELWLADMAEICITFCAIENSDAIAFWLGSKRGCRRYHIDNVPRRLLVTYAGKGTEWLPDEAADRDAFESGEPNEKIVKDPSALKFMNQWDVAVFRGGSTGLLHRTPDAALTRPSILMRLDCSSFWERGVESRN